MTPLERGREVKTDHLGSASRGEMLGAWGQGYSSGARQTGLLISCVTLGSCLTSLASVSPSVKWDCHGAYLRQSFWLPARPSEVKAIMLGVMNLCGPDTSQCPQGNLPVHPLVLWE